MNIFSEPFGFAIVFLITMGRTRDLSEVQVAQIEILLKETGYTIREISKRCNVSIGSVHNVKKRLSDTLPYHKRSGNCGRKKKTTAHDDRVLMNNLKKNLTKSSRELRNQWTQSGVQVSSRTVRRRLNDLGVSFNCCKESSCFNQHDEEESIGIRQKTR